MKFFLNIIVKILYNNNKNNKNNKIYKKLIYLLTLYFKIQIKILITLK